MLRIVCVVVMLSALAAHAAEVVNLGRPCRAFQVLAGRVIADPAGHEWLVLTNMNELTGAELIFIDPKTNEGKVFRAPKGQGSWALVRISGDRLVVGTYYDGQFMIFDLKTMQFVKTAGFKGEEYIWELALGGDGRLYGCTYPGAKLGALDLNTYEVEDLGAPAKPNLYLRNVSATHDGRILCNFIAEEPTQLLFDPKTKQFQSPPKNIAGVQTGVEWNGYFLAGFSWDSKSAKVRAFNGENFEEVDPLPFPVPTGEGFAVDRATTTHDTLYLRAGKSIYRYRAGEKELTLVAKSWPGGFYGETTTGDVLGIRGQEYVVQHAGENEPKFLPIPVTGGPRETHFLRADDRGRVWGGPTFGQTVFWLDPATKKSVNTSQVCDSGGEVYDAAFANGKVYLVAYSGGDVVEYDPDQPWNQIGNKNPRTLAHLSPRGFIRPIAGVTIGPGGKIFAGWTATYGKYGGAVSITDPMTGETDLIENPLGEQAIAGVAVDDKNIYIGTSLGANGLPNKSGASAQFGVLDLATRKVQFHQIFDGSATVGHLFYDRKTKLVTLDPNGKLQLFDPATKKFTTTDIAVSGHAIVGIGDGKIYFAQERNVIAFDLESRTPTTIATAPAHIVNVAISPAGELFISCGADVFAVKR